MEKEIIHMNNVIDRIPSDIRKRYPMKAAECFALADMGRFDAIVKAYNYGLARGRSAEKNRQKKEAAAHG